MHSDEGTTTFGDPDDFAIEAGVEPGLTPPSQVWGRSCVWCRGNALGDIADHNCGLGGTFQGFQRLAEHIDELWDDALAGLDDQEMWNFLDGLLYGYHGDVAIDDDRSLEQIHADCDRYGKFNFLTNWDEQFDGYKSFILCPPGSGIVRILSRAFPCEVGLGVNVSKTGFLGAVQAFIGWFKEQERRLSSRCV